MSVRTILWISIASCVLAAGGLALGQRVVSRKGEAAQQSIFLQAKAGKFNEVNPPLLVRRGIPVELTVRNAESGAIAHDFVLVGLGIRTPKPLQPGESASLRFTPSRSGEFAYTCSLHPGLMDGRLIVRP
ncbi:MAG TPA: cupredoxin domain-containing protein [Candidatus Methylomirabilis sp.]|nr:cupredoxin domain-containing protein [Candidatus Methylomirabilis sp.]